MIWYKCSIIKERRNPQKPEFNSYFFLGANCSPDRVKSMM